MSKGHLACRKIGPGRAKTAYSSNQHKDKKRPSHYHQLETTESPVDVKMKLIFTFSEKHRFDATF